MKKNYFTLAFMLFTLLPVTFVSCSDDDDEVDPTAPTVTVTAASFEDTDLTEGAIGGALTWSAPASVDNVTNYVIYTSESAADKGTKLGEVAVGTNSYTIAAGTEFAGYIHIVASNALGEAATWCSISITDATRPFEGYYVLSSGSFGSNNSLLSFYDLNTKTTTADQFNAVNSRGLGDTANDFIVYGNKMYIAVYNSALLEVTDLKAKSLAQLKGTDEELVPRSLIADGGFVYVASYNGYVAKVDTATLKIAATVKVGRNPEKMAIANGKLYVANSGGMDYSTALGYDKTVSVVDLELFKETKKIDVVLNPVNLLAAPNGDVYLVSMGNYSDIPNTLQVIDSSTDAVSTVTATNATEFDILGSTLYLMYSQYDANWNQVISFISYNSESKSVISNNFITDGSALPKPYKIGTDAVNKYVYITQSDYKTNGKVDFFNEAGALQFSVAAGINPIKAIYVKK